MRYWFESGNNVIARVGCASAAGAAADTRFTASFMRAPGEPAISVAEDTLTSFYLYGNAPAPSSYYYSDSYGAGTATLEGPSTGLATGTYRAHLAGVAPTGSTAVVTAYGYGNAYCNIGGWNNDPAGGTIVDVRCYDAAGAPTNSIFTLFYNTNQYILY